MITAEMIAAECRRIFQSNPHNYIASSTVQFHLIVDGMVGKVTSSGAIISVRGQRYIVTVLHGFDNNVGMLCKELSSGRVAIVEPKRYPVFLSQKLRDDGGRGDPFVDFTFFPLQEGYIPIRKMRFVDTGQETCFDIRELPILPIEVLANAPLYSLGGATPHSDSDTEPYAEFRCIFRISNISTKQEPYVYFSTVGSTIESGVKYNGLSGAPILDENGVPVALMCGPCNEDARGNKIPMLFWGIAINYAVHMIESETTNDIPKFKTMTDEEKDALAKRAIELGSYFYDNDYEIKNMLWNRSP